MTESDDLSLVATCALGLEPFLHREIAELGLPSAVVGTGAVRFRAAWSEVWRANYWLRTANRVLVELGSWPARDGDELHAGARALVASKTRWGGVGARQLFDPSRSLSVRATSSRSQLRDVRWIALRLKDAVVDAQREIWGRRSSVDRRQPGLPLRAWVHEDRASLLLDSSREPLDRRGYRRQGGPAPLREQLAAACVLAAEWSGEGPVVDPMCGSGTLLAEAGWIQAGIAPGSLRRHWVFEEWPWLDRRQWQAIRDERPSPLGSPSPLVGYDLSPEAVAAARDNLAAAGLASRVRLECVDGLEQPAPAASGLVLVNPPYGERLEADDELWRRLGDWLKRGFAGWRAVVLAGDPRRGRTIGLRPSRRLAVRNGPIEARILVFDLFRGSGR